MKLKYWFIKVKRWSTGINIELCQISAHVFQQNVSTWEYKVPATKCKPIIDGYRIDLCKEISIFNDEYVKNLQSYISGDNNELIVSHVFGHTWGSIVCYYLKKKTLFTDDFVYGYSDSAKMKPWIKFFEMKLQKFIINRSIKKKNLLMKLIQVIYLYHK
jgi:glyoxylase-like metal-dependent hydrolase (beta-lactamase superfamily II)